MLYGKMRKGSDKLKGIPCVVIASGSRKGQVIEVLLFAETSEQI